MQALDGPQRTAMGHQRHHEADFLCRGPQAIEGGALRYAKCDYGTSCLLGLWHTLRGGQNVAVGAVTVLQALLGEHTGFTTV